MLVRLQQDPIRHRRPTWFDTDARPSQRPPPGEWRIWLILAGRGWGKTRTIVEWAKLMSHAMPGSRGAIVAATSADGRDVLAEGPAGFLATSPADDMPLYEPSKRRITWGNGSMATLFSAEEPNRLRGPQHHWAICDELCLIAGTMISTDKGLVSIENIRPGDRVHTRDGLRRVKRSWKTSDAARVYRLSASDGKVLIGTGNHPIWVENKGFTPLQNVHYGDILMVWDTNHQNQNHHLKALSQALHGTENAIGSMLATTWIDAAGCYTGRSTDSITGRFRRAGKFTTRTGIERIATYQISKLSQRAIISSYIGKSIGGVLPDKASNLVKPLTSFGGKENRTRPLARIAGKISRQRRRSPNTVRPNAEPPPIVNLACLCPRQENVSIVGESSPTIRVQSNIAPRNAITPRRPKSDTLALFAGRISTQEVRPRSVARKNAATNTAVCAVTVTPLPDLLPVYNLEIEGCHEYFANGILTHNCAWQYPETFDMLLFGLRIGRDPRLAIATTPRPTKEVKALLKQPGVVVTRGTTYENLDNLAPAFREQIIARYEGTRLGRQELNAELLEDIEGALWQRSQIDADRAKTAPELRRILVGVDPKASKVADSETGIVVAGLGADGHGYVLADYSLNGSPEQWARKVATAYEAHQADKVIVEKNNGGDMVLSVLKATGVALPISPVWASRGKFTRAEPVQALYEQHKIHHVGVLPGLEDQMCSWVPEESDSPDRVDALVWALTALMLTNAHREIRQTQG